jgi:hypothetical protein
MTFPRTVLSVTGVAFLLLGGAYLIHPRDLMTAFGVDVTLPRGATEIRALFGGLRLGLGGFFIVAAIRERWIRPGLAAQFCCFAGLAGGRILGMLASRRIEQGQVLTLLIEGIAAIAGLMAFFHVKRLIVSSMIDQRRSA